MFDYLQNFTNVFFSIFLNFILIFQAIVAMLTKLVN